MAGTWTYRGYYMHQAGCWVDGGVHYCLIDSVLEAFSGTIVFGPPRDSVSGATPKPWKNWTVPYHFVDSVKQWDYLGACNGQPLSCFTGAAPTLTYVETTDSILEVAQYAYEDAQLFLRNGRVGWLWTTADVHPVRLYDSLAAAPPPAMPGVRDLQKH